ncbi:MAG: hypothetical protein AB1861_11800 [Cyanobacteriota bacterium]
MNDEALEINDFDPKLLTALASIHQPLIIATSAPAFSKKLITNGVRKSVADDALKHWNSAFHYIFYRQTNQKHEFTNCRNIKSNKHKALNA